MEQKFDDSTIHEGLTLLGQARSQATKKLECFKAPPKGIKVVTISSDEITAFCPLTHQPDFYSIRLRYCPNDLCIESKAFKLYLMSFRETGHFIEALSKIMLDDFVEACHPKWMEVELEMKPRGGITINSIAEYKAE